MKELYHLVGDRAQRGPLRREELLQLWEDGEISASQNCVPEEGGAPILIADLLSDPTLTQIDETVASHTPSSNQPTGIHDPLGGHSGHPSAPLQPVKLGLESDARPYQEGARPPEHAVKTYTQSTDGSKVQPEDSHPPLPSSDPFTVEFFAGKDGGTNRPLLPREFPQTGRVPMIGDTVPNREKVDDDGDPGEVLWQGHPTIFSYPNGLAITLLSGLVGFGTSVFTGSGIWTILGLILALLILCFLFIDRAFTKYTITRMRVELHWGLFVRNSKEVRIRDIRAINIVRKGLLGLLGIGRVEFSSAGSEEIEVAFDHVWKAGAVKRVVRKVQDH